MTSFDKLAYRLHDFNSDRILFSAHLFWLCAKKILCLHIKLKIVQ